MKGVLEWIIDCTRLDQEIDDIHKDCVTDKSLNPSHTTVNYIS